LRGRGAIQRSSYEHGSRGEQVDCCILKAIKDRHLTERGEGIGIMSSQTLGGCHPIHKNALAGGGKTMEQLEAGHRVAIRIAGMDRQAGICVEGTSQVRLAHETDEAGDLQHCILLSRNVAQECQSVAAHVI
jgi:hypothetical protein